MSPRSKSIAAVILGAGESSRFGQPKQLLQFQGKPSIRRVVDAASEANCSLVIVVTGNAHDEVKDAIRECDAIVTENKEWKAGIGISKLDATGRGPVN